MKRVLYSGVALIALTGGAFAAAHNACSGITLADTGGIDEGKYRQQYELAAFQAAAGCTMSFQSNPEAAANNSAIRGNGALMDLADRIPAEPLDDLLHDFPSALAA